MELISIAFSLEITLYHHPNKPFLIFEKEEHLKYIHVLKQAAKTVSFSLSTLFVSKFGAGKLRINLSKGF